MNGTGHVEVGGERLRYTVEGTGPAVLVAGSAVYYPRTFSRSLRRECTLVCMDLPHFTRSVVSPERRPISFEGYAGCIEAVATALGLAKVTVLGHSHHGNVALEYARRHPRRVNGVVMIGSPPVDVARTNAAAEAYWSSEASAQRKAILAQRRAQCDASLDPAETATARYVARYVADAPLYWADPNYDAAWLWEGMEFDMDSVGAFRDLYLDYALPGPGDGFDGPLLVMSGRYDFAVPHTLWRPWLPSLAARAEWHLFEGSGHTPQLEQPAEFDRRFLGWLHGRVAGTTPRP